MWAVCFSKNQICILYLTPLAAVVDWVLTVHIEQAVTNNGISGY